MSLKVRKERNGRRAFLPQFTKIEESMKNTLEGDDGWAHRYRRQLRSTPALFPHRDISLSDVQTDLRFSHTALSRFCLDYASLRQYQVSPQTQHRSCVFSSGLPRLYSKEFHPHRALSELLWSTGTHVVGVDDQLDDIAGVCRQRSHCWLRDQVFQFLQLKDKARQILFITQLALTEQATCIFKHSFPIHFLNHFGSQT